MRTSLKDFEFAVQRLCALGNKLNSGQPVSPEWASSNMFIMLTPILSVMSELAQTHVVLNVLPKTWDNGEVVHHTFVTSDMNGFLDGDQGKISMGSIQRWIAHSQSKPASFFVTLVALIADLSLVEPVPLETEAFTGGGGGSLFARDVVQLIQSAATRYLPELREALASVQAYEALGPPQADKDILTRWRMSIVGDTSLLPSTPLDLQSEQEWILNPLPEPFVQITTNAHSFSSPGFLFYWLNTQPFLDPHTGLQLGGFHGAAFGVKLIVRLLIALFKAEQDAGHHVHLFGRMTIECLWLYIRQFTILLSDQVNSSLEILRDQRQSHMITPRLRFSLVQHNIPSWRHHVTGVNSRIKHLLQQPVVKQQVSDS
ncbi:hypothetical protein FRC08_013001 [Ceratobasidium sp. 394]|nr:hypothetical protein FRC08_013001 [Ceratobasidium sp. 394]